MAFYCQNMLEIALILAEHDPVYEEYAFNSSSTSCGSPMRWTASANTTTRCGTRRTGSSTTSCACLTASAMRLKVRSMVGLLPLCAVHGLRGRA